MRDLNADLIEWKVGMGAQTITDAIAFAEIVLPEAIERAIAAEAENADLRAVLDKLARLGAEPHYGNSFGNVIARQALAELEEGE